MRLIGFKKEISSSFIAEHMMVKVEYMKDLVATIESNEELLGYHYWEKIVSAIDSNVLLGFSEFETYGTFISQKYPESFLFRTLQTYRRAGEIYGRYISKKELNNINGLDTISLEPADSPRLLRRICQFPLRVGIKLISVFY